MKPKKAAIVWIAGAASLGGTSLAQVPPNGAQPVPGTGNATSISSANRENQSSYNNLVGAADTKSSGTGEKPKRSSSAVPATPADIKPGSALRDSQGAKIGTIDSVEADGAVINTGQTKIKVPLVAFGKDDQGLLLGITAAKFNELVAKAHGPS